MKEKNGVKIIGRGYLGKVLSGSMGGNNSVIGLKDFSDVSFDSPQKVVLASGPSTPTASEVEIKPWKDLIEQLIINIRDRNFVSSLVYLSSAGTLYGECLEKYPNEEMRPSPSTPYSRYHLWVEQVLRGLTATNVTVLRITNPYGPLQLGKEKQGFISACIKAIKNNTDLVIYGDGTSSRDYLHESDFVDACLKVLERQRPANAFEIYNLGSGISRTQVEVLELIKEIFGRVPQIFYLPPRIEDLRRSAIDTSKFKSTFQWVPKLDLAAGLRTYEDFLCS